MDAGKTGKSCRHIRKYTEFKEKKSIDINFFFFSFNKSAFSINFFFFLNVM